MLADARRHHRLEDRVRTMTSHPITRHPATRVGAAVTALAALAAGVAIPLTGLSSARGNDNLVRNGGFEKGLKGWHSSDKLRGLSVVRDAHSGKLAIRTTALSNGRFAIRDAPNTVRDTPADATYRASAWVKGSTPGMAVSLRVREVRQDRIPGTRIRVLVRKQTADTVLRDSDWHRLTFDFSTDPGHQLDLGVLVWNGLKGQSLTVDDVSLVRLDGPPQVAPTTSSPAPQPDPSATPTPGGSKKPNVITPTPKPEPTTDPEPTQAVGDTMFGVTPWAASGESSAQAIARRDTTLGHSQIMRIFYPGLPVAWPGAAGKADRPVVVSFKANPKDILSGKLDSTFRSWFADAPKDRLVLWSYFHEPEDNIANGEFTASQYRQAWVRLAGLADEAKNPKLKATLILMDWTLRKASGRNWRDYYPGKDVIDVLGWDAYNEGSLPNKSADKRSYRDPAEVFGTAVAVSKAEGKPFGFAEWGSLLLPGDNGTARAAWIRASTKYIAASGAMFATYFDTPIGRGDWRLTDTPSQQALKAAITG